MERNIRIKDLKSTMTLWVSYLCPSLFLTDFSTRLENWCLIATDSLSHPPPTKRKLPANLVPNLKYQEEFSLAHLESGGHSWTNHQ